MIIQPDQVGSKYKRLIIDGSDEFIQRKQRRIEVTKFLMWAVICIVAIAMCFRSIAYRSEGDHGLSVIPLVFICIYIGFWKISKYQEEIELALLFMNTNVIDEIRKAAQQGDAPEPGTISCRDSIGVSPRAR